MTRAAQPIELVDVVTDMRVGAIGIAVTGGVFLLWGLAAGSFRALAVALPSIVVAAAVDHRMATAPTLEQLAAVAEREPAGAVRRPARFAIRKLGTALIGVVLCGVAVAFLGPVAAVGMSAMLCVVGVRRLIHARRLLASERRERVRLSAVASVRPRFRASTKPTYYLTPEHLR